MRNAALPSPRTSRPPSGSLRPRDLTIEELSAEITRLFYVDLDTFNEVLGRNALNSGRASGSAALQRNVVVLLPGILQVLVAQHPERARHAAAGRMRHDHLVDIAALGGDEG